jgi:hypothetical protein
MADIFNEIDDDLRHDRYRKLWDRYGVVVLIAAAAIVLGVAGWRGYGYWRDLKAAEAGDLYYAALRQVDNGDVAGATEALKTLADTGPAGYGIVARLQVAGLAAKQDRKAGIAAYEAVAARSGVPKVIADLAAIQAAYLALDVEDAKAIEARVGRFLLPGEPFRHSAREILVLAAMQAGDWVAAGNRLDEMQADAELPQSFQRRIDVLAGVIKAETPLPPAPAPAASAPASNTPAAPAPTPAKQVP